MSAASRLWLACIALTACAALFGVAIGATVSDPPSYGVPGSATIERESDQSLDDGTLIIRGINTFNSDEAVKLPSAYTMKVAIQEDDSDDSSVRHQVRYADHRMRVDEYDSDGVLTRTVIKPPQSWGTILCLPTSEKCRYRVLELDLESEGFGARYIETPIDGPFLDSLRARSPGYADGFHTRLADDENGGFNLPNVVEPATHYTRPIAGERAYCTVWSDEGIRKITWETCETADGIELFRRRSSEARTMSQLAVEFERGVPDGIFVPPYAEAPTATP